MKKSNSCQFSSLGNPMNVLVIVDMQPEFEASTDKQCQVKVAEAIEQAKKNKDMIIFLEYSASFLHGETFKSLTDLCTNYKNTKTLIKCMDDGSSVISRYIVVELGYSPDSVKTFKVCGVNKIACVSSTAVGLGKLFPKSKIVLLDDACNCRCNESCDTRPGQFRQPCPENCRGIWKWEHKDWKKDVFPKYVRNMSILTNGSLIPVSYNNAS